MKLIKYAVAVLSVILAALILIPVNVISADKVVIEVENANGNVRDSVDINIRISENSNLAAATFELVYDPAVLEVTGAKRGDGLNDGMADVYYNPETGKVRMAYINMDGFNGSGSILNISFRIKDNAAGTTSVSVIVEDFADNNYKDIPYEIISGSIKVLTPGYMVEFLDGSSVYHFASVAAGSLLVEPAAPRKPGYIFKGWFKDKEFLSEWNFSGDRIYSDVNLYARWEEENILNSTDTVIIPYTLKEGEDPESIIVYEDASEKPSVGRYVEDLEAVVIKGGDSKDYEIAYNKVSFTDVFDNSWYYKAVSFLAARQIVKGVGGDRFAPGNNVLRADFLIMTMNAFGIDVSEDLSDNFADAGSKYYTKYLGTAKELGFVLGSGNNMFRPEDLISRQDMMLILYRILDYTKMLPENKGSSKASDFVDHTDISIYALPVVEFFVEHDIIRGSQNRLSPLNTLTRAEAAQVIYNLLTVE